MLRYFSRSYSFTFITLRKHWIAFKVFYCTNPQRVQLIAMDSHSISRFSSTVPCGRELRVPEKRCREKNRNPIQFWCCRRPRRRRRPSMNKFYFRFIDVANGGPNILHRKWNCWKVLPSGGSFLAMQQKVNTLNDSSNRISHYERMKLWK